MIDEAAERQIWSAHDATRDEIDPSRFLQVLLLEAVMMTTARRDIDLDATSVHGRLMAGRAAPLIRAAAEALMRAPRRQRLMLIERLGDLGGRHDNLFFATAEAAQQLADMLSEARAVRFRGQASLRVALEAAVGAAERGVSSRLVLEVEYPRMAQMAEALAIVLECRLDVRDLEHKVDGETFDLDVAMPPINHQVELHRVRNLSSRSASLLGAERGERRTTSEARMLAEATVDTPHATLLVVSERILARTVGVEPVLRSTLVATGRLRAILSCPNSMVWRDTSIGAAVLVISPKDTAHVRVRFVDLGSPRFSTKTRGKAQPIERGCWVRALSAAPGDDIADVDQMELLSDDSVLSVARRLEPEWKRRFSAFLASGKTALLGDICDIIRPAPLPKSENGPYTVREAGPGDIGDTGFVMTPARMTALDENGRRIARKHRLEPGDLVLSFKGVIGAVGIVPSDVPGAEDDAYWTASQSMAILRLRDNAPISVVALREFLSSPAVREYLGSITVGAVSMGIPVKALREVPIAVPDASVQQDVQSRFEERLTLHARIAELKDAIERIQRETWPNDAIAIEA